MSVGTTWYSSRRHIHIYLITPRGADCRGFVRNRFVVQPEGTTMAESVYKIIELVGTSTESWEKAAAAAISRAGETLRDLRIAEVSALDLQLNAGKVETYRAKVKVSFKYEGGS
jgi:flavin-binding protein dodecin